MNRIEYDTETIKEVKWRVRNRKLLNIIHKIKLIMLIIKDKISKLV